MNQKQANRVVKAIEFFEHLKTKEINLAMIKGTEINYDLDEIIDHINNCIANKEKISCSFLNKLTKDCESYGCFCGWMPSIFPKTFKTVVEDGQYQFPTVNGERYKDYDNMDDSHGYLKLYADFFGISDFASLERMIFHGNRPSRSFAEKSDKAAIIAFLKNQLDLNGYEIVAA